MLMKVQMSVGVDRIVFWWRLSNVAALVLLFTTAKSVSAGEFRDDKPRIVEGNHGVVAADDERCSLIGVRILRLGGNAVDAAVATVLCLGVVNPTSSGIGGGGLLLVRRSDGTAEAYDMRETAPAAAPKALYDSNPSLLTQGILSVGVPGELAGLHLVWQRHGKLPWERLFRPAIELARNGFVVSRYLAELLQRLEALVLGSEGLRQIFAPKGTVLVAGDICYRETLANTFCAVADQGPSVLYNGSVGEKLASDIQAAGGILNLTDLQQYKVKIRQPLSTDVLGMTVLGMPPPSAGGACTALILNIFAAYGLGGATGAVGLHRTVEALKHCYALRMNLGDPDFIDISAVLADMLSSNFSDKLQHTINDTTTFGPEHYGGRWNPVNDHGTSHLCVVDKERNAVALTSSINTPFGSLFVSPSTGIIMNDEMGDFSVAQSGSSQFPTSPANLVAPNKRPLSSMTPTIVLEGGQLRGVLGGSGGLRIISAVVQVLLNGFVKGMDPLSSVLEPRVHHQWLPNVLRYENFTAVSGQHFEVEADLRDALQRRGHVLQSDNKSGAIVQLIVQELADAGRSKLIKYRKLIGVSDPRKDGVPAGY